MLCNTKYRMEKCEEAGAGRKALNRDFTGCFQTQCTATDPAVGSERVRKTPTLCAADWFYIVTDSRLNAGSDEFPTG